MTFQGKRVSAEWKVVLEAAWDDGVRMRLNSGARTFAEQAALYRLYQSGRGNLAAVPSHTAPHIRTGRPDHALDVDMHVGDGVQGLAKWLRKQGVSVAWTVPGECVPMDTQILTRRGFKAPHELVAGDETLGYDPAIGRARWTPITHWQSYGHQEVLRHQHEYLALDCTVGHRWLLRRHRGAPLGLVSLADAPGEAVVTLAAEARVDTKALDITPDEAALLGWALTDGSIYRFENSRGKRAFARVYQTERKAVGVQAVERVMSGFAHTRDDDFVPSSPAEHSRCIRWYVGRPTFSPILERSRLDDLGAVGFVLALDDAQRKAFLGAVRMAEGCQEGGLRKIAQNTHKDADRREAFAIASAMEGYLVADRPGTRELGLKRPRAYAANLRTTSLGEQEVWCPTTELGTWTARQNDHIFLTGNSWHIETPRADLERLARELDNPHPTLRPGDRGSAVRRAQGLMRDRGLMSVTTDGVYGPDTASAARRLHHAYGHVAFDHVGAAMWTILEGEHPWSVLLPGERETLAVLEARRRSARRNGGWDKIASLHLEAAVVLKASLIEQRKRIWRAAQVSGWRKVNRRRRYQILKQHTT